MLIPLCKEKKIFFFLAFSENLVSLLSKLARLLAEESHGRVGMVTDLFLLLTLRFKDAK